MTTTRIPTIAARAAAAAVLAAFLVTSASPAQESDDGGDDFEPRSGFWLSGGLGGGTNDEGNGGGAAYVRLGGTLGPRLLLGGDAVGFAREIDSPEAQDTDVTRSNVTASLLYYVSDRGNFFVKGGLGLAHAEFSEDLGDITVSFEDTGVGVTLGAGYDVQLGDGNLFLTPNVNVLLQGFDGVDVLDEGLFLLTVGLGFR